MVQRFTFFNRLPMAGLEPARAFYGPTDFKSVASTISPHRRCAAHLKLVMQSAKTNFVLTDLHLEQPKAFRCPRHKKQTAFAEVESAMRAYSELIRHIGEIFPTSASLRASESGGGHFPARFLLADHLGRYNDIDSAWHKTDLRLPTYLHPFSIEKYRNIFA